MIKPLDFVNEYKKNCGKTSFTEDDMLTSFTTGRISILDWSEYTFLYVLLSKVISEEFPKRNFKAERCWNDLRKVANKDIIEYWDSLLSKDILKEIIKEV